MPDGEPVPRHRERAAGEPGRRIGGGHEGASAVDLGPRFSGFRAATQQIDTSTRLVIDLLGQVETAASPPAPPPSPPADLPGAGRDTASIRTIVIDPGHGGKDAGVKGAEGALEKELTLVIARRAKAAIESRLGIRVLLTREDDRSVPLEERTAVANNNKADLFLSLHVNGSLRTSTRGASIYVAAFSDSGLQCIAIHGEHSSSPSFGRWMRNSIERDHGTRTICRPPSALG